jgi:hypothetical protein
MDVSKPRGSGICALTFTSPFLCLQGWNLHQKPKRRLPKQNSGFIEITKPRQRNNGNVEVVQSDYLTAEEQKVLADEVMINGRRYRIPERVIRLDFWNRINGIPLEWVISEPSISK